MEAWLKLIRTVDIGVPGLREIDLSVIPEGIVAVTGDVGAGKTMLIESALPGSVWCRMPSRVPASKPAHCAVSRKASMQSVWAIDGTEYTFAHEFDGAKQSHKKATIRGPGGAHVSRCGVTADGKVGTFKIVRDNLFGGDTWESIAASVFWVQKGGGAFTRLGQTAAKGILSQLLGAQKHAAIFSIVSDWLKTLRAQHSAAVDTELTIRGEADREKRRALDVCRVRRDLLRAARIRGRTLSILLKTPDVRAGSITPAEYSSLQQQEKGLEAQIATAQLAVLTDEDIASLESSQARDRQAQRLMLDRQQILIPEHDVDEAEFKACRAKQILDGFKTKLDSCRSAQVRASVPCGGDGKHSACRFLPAPPSGPADPAEENAVLGEIRTATADAAAAERCEMAERNKKATADQGAIRLASIDQSLSELGGDVVADAEQKLRDHRTAQSTLNHCGAELRGVKGRLSRVSVADAGAATLRADAVRHEADAKREVLVLRERVASLEKYSDAEALERWRDASRNLDRLAKQLEEHTVVREAFHASGIPEALVRSAGPEVARRAIEMLTAVIGHERFIIDLDDGVHVTDTDRAIFGGGPLRKEVANLSGGQEALVESAVRMAVAEVSGSRGATRWRTVFADEMSSGLGTSAPSWVALLKESSKRQELRHLLVVSHDPRVVACTDAEVFIGADNARRTG